MGRPIGEKRSFVVQWPAAAAGGRFVATTPYGAARKACHRLIPKDDKSVTSFVLRETTQDSPHRHQLYGYSGTSKPNLRQVVLGDRSVTMHRDIVVRSLSQQDVDKLLASA